jgi:hypothetical protein
MTGSEVIARVSYRPRESLTPWRFAAVAWMIVAATVVSVTNTLDYCGGGVTTAIIVIGWILAPVLSIASTSVVAVKTEDTGERATAVVLAIVMTAGWMYAIAWMGLGMALEGMGC